MIVKCIALLAVVAQISASAYNTNSGFGSSVNSVPTRNYIAKGKYPVALENNGPTPDRRIPVTTTHVRTPVQEKPTVRLPYRIPAPRTVSHSCTCYKTIVRPRVHQHIITVPSIQRYIETSHKPIIENIHYEAVPIESNNSGVNSNNAVASGFSITSSVPLTSGVVTSGSSSTSSTYPYISSLPVGSLPSGYSYSGVGNYN